MISSKPHMIDYIESLDVSNNSAHDRLIERECFLGRILKAQASLEVPTIYKTFSAYNLISATCGAHSSVMAGGQYSLNTWMLLVGPSAGRKSSAISPIQNLMQSSEILRDFTFSENTNSAAMREPMLDSYDLAKSIFKDDKFARVNGTFYIQEFHDFYSAKGGQEDSFSSYLVKLWGDNPVVRIERVGKGAYDLERPTISFLSAIQTLRVMDVIPISEWRQGFFPRIIPIYSDQSWTNDQIKPINWKEGSKASLVLNDGSHTPYQDLLLDFQEECIAMTRSYFVCAFNDETSELYNDLELPPVRIQMKEYENRRSEHFRKLCGITAISRAWKGKPVKDYAVVITKEDFEIARMLMTYNDFKLTKFCDDSIRSPDAEMYDRLEELIDDRGGSIDEKQLKEFIRTSIPAYQAMAKELVIKKYILKKIKIGNEFVYQSLKENDS